MSTDRMDASRRNQIFLLVGLCVLVCVLLVAGVVAGTNLWREHFQGGQGEITYEVTGPADATADVTRVLPMSDASPVDSLNVAAHPLPFTSRASVGAGTYEIQATPSKGALTCRILLDGKEATKLTSAAGQPVTCTATGKANAEVTYEVTGPRGATAEIHRMQPSSDKRNAVTSTQQSLPFTSRASVGTGTFDVRATPSKGALTCRIVLDGKEAAKQTGAPGQPVTCTVTIN